ncbi:helix-turn-helix domain-containing protein [Pseudoalteromonas sp. JBTF-M23]|uniref:Helix-turn-helix domain-containing protein n=1 Tax=Pseudoalteromonas caenipelagi TaxID=2726988 RepID=A0A849VBG2_9GAMM|nr:helix-turn-helix domain-containing protein [Pseudoalteromonas caenipelagi]NOU49324.1 helix-turn-helix domain-containing protein [Pseudoalteromonas caenipelagi]
MYQVAIICPDNALATGITGVIDILNVANTINKKKIFSWYLVGVHDKQVITSQGLVLPCDKKLAELDKVDVMLWIGSQFRGHQKLWRDCQTYVPLAQHIKQLAQHSEHVIATCTSVSYLAVSGFLDSYQVTSSWWLKSFYQRYFPQLKVSQEKIYLQDGKVLTSGAAQSYFSMMVYFIAQTCGSELAEELSSWLAIPKLSVSQSSYMHVGAFELHQDERLLSLQNYIKAHLSQALTLNSLAKQLSVSERTLIRRFQKQVGLSPSHYVRLARLEKAKQLLRTTRMNINEVAWQVGYQDLGSFNRVFKDQYGQTLADYRQQFS